MRADRDVVMAAVAQNGCALRFAAEDLRGDRDIVLVAVSRAGSALQDAAEVRGVYMCDNTKKYSDFSDHMGGTVDLCLGRDKHKNAK